MHGAWRLGEAPDERWDIFDLQGQMNRLERALGGLEAGTGAEIEQNRTAQRGAVVALTAAGQTDVRRPGLRRNPAQQRQTEVRLDDGPAVGRCEVGDAVVLEDSRDLAEMGELVGPRADVLDHVVRDDDVEEPLGEGEGSVLRRDEPEALMDEPRISDVDAPDFALASDEPAEVCCDDPGADADLEDDGAPKLTFVLEECRDLRRLLAPRSWIERLVTSSGVPVSDYLVSSRSP
jgi:hypothetical protein